MSKTINNLNKSLKDLGLTEEQIIELIKNNISGDITKLNTSNKSSLVAAINEVFQSGNSAKQELVAALVAKGLNATTNMTFSQLIDNVEANLVKPAGNASANQVLQGSTFMNSTGQLQTGTVPYLQSNIPNVNQYTANHYMTSAIQVADLSGVGGNCVYFAMPTGVYNTIPWLMSYCPNLRSENIVSGKDILGVWGNASLLKVVAGTNYMLHDYHPNSRDWIPYYGSTYQGFSNLSEGRTVKTIPYSGTYTCVAYVHQFQYTNTGYAKIVVFDASGNILRSSEEFNFGNKTVSFSATFSVEAGQKIGIIQKSNGDIYTTVDRFYIQFNLTY